MVVEPVHGTDALRANRSWDWAHGLIILVALRAPWRSAQKLPMGHRDTILRISHSLSLLSDYY